MRKNEIPTRKIRIYKGLPGSGKTTAAQKLIAFNPKIDFLRLNNDELSGSLTNLNKDQLVTISETLLHYAMTQEKYVLIDNTNLSPARVAKYREIVAKWNQANLDKQYEIEFEGLTHVPLWECQRRNSLRTNPVPPKVITDMLKHISCLPFQASK